MSNTVCVVCKGPIDEALVVHTDKGPVHPGACYNYAIELPVTEDTEEQLQETQLLIQSSVDVANWLCPFLSVGAFCIRSLRHLHLQNRLQEPVYAPPKHHAQ